MIGKCTENCDSVEKMDMLLYGESFVLEKSDGTKENIHPSWIYFKDKGGKMKMMLKIIKYALIILVPNFLLYYTFAIALRSFNFKVWSNNGSYGFGFVSFFVNAILIIGLVYEIEKDKGGN